MKFLKSGMNITLTCLCAGVPKLFFYGLNAGLVEDLGGLRVAKRMKRRCQPFCTTDRNRPIDCFGSLGHDGWRTRSGTPICRALLEWSTALKEVRHLFLESHGHLVFESTSQSRQV